MLWKAYIDFEIASGERRRGRRLYERLLERTKHVKVWLSYAKFESEPLPTAPVEEEEEQEAAGGGRGGGGDASTSGGGGGKDDEGEESGAARAAAARGVYERAFECLRETAPDAKEEALMVLEAWRSMERAAAAASEEERRRLVGAVEAKMPKRVKRKRPLRMEDGRQVGMEEYYDYIFPGEGSAAAPHLKLLEAAYKWKRQRTEEAPPPAAVAAAQQQAAAVAAPTEEGAGGSGDGGGSGSEARQGEEDDAEEQDGGGAQPALLATSGAAMDAGHGEDGQGQ